MNFSELKILVIEDNQTMRTLIGTVLHGIGVRDIVTATDGMHGLCVLMSENPDVVIVDWEMPNFDGIQFTRMVRSSPNVPDGNIPIIMCTTHSDVARVKEAQVAGVNEYISKPFSPKDFEARLTRVVKKFYSGSAESVGAERRRRSLANYEAKRRDEKK
jgi:CheY-like chemotaxis protein